MGDKSWKAWERTVAKWFGGKRRGPDVTGGKSDVIVPGWAVEAKLLGRPSFSDCLRACEQAERNGKPDELPVAVVKRKGDKGNNALCIIRLEVFADWFLPVQTDPGQRPTTGDPSIPTV